MLREEGVGVTLEPSRGEHGTLFATGRDGGDDAVPGVVLVAEHYNLIARLLEQGVPVELQVDVQARFHEEDTNGYNVIAEITGVDPEIGDEVVMIGPVQSLLRLPGGLQRFVAADGQVGEQRAVEAIDAVQVSFHRLHW